MCGIAGILRIQDPTQGLLSPQEAIPEPWLDILDESIKHRGPDGKGRFRDRATRPDGKVVDVALVHRRLAIIDLSANAAQPMVIQGGTALLASVPDGPALQSCDSGASNPAQRAGPPQISREGSPYGPCQTHHCPKCNTLTAIAFNGCIYNHQELRKELQSLGHEFFTDHSDTEVLAHGWCEWGTALGRKLDGMYALAIWNRDDGALWAARDRFGEKPVYSTREYLQKDEYGIAFSSSAAGLAHLTRVVGSGLYLDDHGLGEWLAGGWYEPRTPFARIRCIQSGELLALSKAAIDRTPYATEAEHWDDYPRNRSGPDLTTADVERLLVDSVQQRLDADVPVGCFLSGGVDSSLIAAIAAQQVPELRTFTVRMPDPAFDESAAAESVASLLGLRHQTLDCQSTPADDLPRLIHQLGLPFGDSSLLPTYWVSRATREHVKVSITGDAGDELFIGYRRYLVARTLKQRADALARIPFGSLPKRYPQSRSSMMARLSDAAREVGYSALLNIFGPTDLRTLLGYKHRISVPNLPGDPLDNAVREDLANYLPGDLLRTVDTASMTVALETRAPFLSRALADAASSSSLGSLMPNGQRKGLLKQVALRYLPPEIVNRPKQGFAIPIGEWFRSDYGQMRQLLYDHLESAEPFPDLPLALNMDFVRQMLKEHDQAGEKSLNPWHGRDHSQRLYMLLVLSIWCKWLQGLSRTPSGI